jgi:predicted enzyme related to lactoylglutathione lyase
MANNLSFFSIHVDDIARARAFYEGVFGWRFEPWGPPGFYLIQTGDERSPGILGSMSGRREPVTGTGIIGFECTIAVDDIDRTIQAALTHGGKIAMAKFSIPTVGTGCYLLDTEGNHVGAMQYETPPHT